MSTCALTLSALPPAATVALVLASAEGHGLFTLAGVTAKQRTSLSTAIDVSSPDNRLLRQCVECAAKVARAAYNADPPAARLLSAAVLFLGCAVDGEAWFPLHVGGDHGRKLPHCMPHAWLQVSRHMLGSAAGTRDCTLYINPFLCVPICTIIK